MRVLLINPWDAEVFPTPSIGYLQATLKANGIDVTAVDLSGAFKNTDYNLVAVTFHSFSVKHAEKIRKYYKGRLICGGHHPSALPDQMLKIGYDQVIIGEGEQAIMDVIEGNISPKVRGRISDIDSLPYPDYTGLGFWNAMGIPIISSRGCPFSCSFCGSSNFWGHKCKTRSADNVLNEISFRISQGFKTWMFEDDLFTVSKKRTLDICAALCEMKPTQWQCASRAESLDEELCRALKLAGCTTVWLGIESLSQGSLDRCNKDTTVLKLINGIKNAEKAGLKTVNQFICGLPGDSILDINETRQQIRRNKILNCGANIIWLLPLTEAYWRAKEKGFNDVEYLINGCPYYTYEQSIETLKYWTTLL